MPRGAMSPTLDYNLTPPHPINKFEVNWGQKGQQLLNYITSEKSLSLSVAVYSSCIIFVHVVSPASPGCYSNIILPDLPALPVPALLPSTKYAFP